VVMIEKADVHDLYAQCSCLLTKTCLICCSRHWLTVPRWYIVRF